MKLLDKTNGLVVNKLLPTNRKQKSQLLKIKGFIMQPNTSKTNYFWSEIDKIPINCKGMKWKTTTR